MFARTVQHSAVRVLCKFKLGSMLSCTIQLPIPGSTGEDSNGTDVQHGTPSQSAGNVFKETCL